MISFPKRSHSAGDLCRSRNFKNVYFKICVMSVVIEGLVSCILYSLLSKPFLNTPTDESSDKEIYV